MNDTRFLCWTIDPVVARQRAVILLEMFSFIRTGLNFDRSRSVDEDLALLEGYIKAKILDRTLSPADKPVPKRMQNDAGDTVDTIAALFKKEHRFISNDAPIAQFSAGSVTKPLADRLGSFAHPSVDEHEPGSMAIAFEVAYSNFARACTRMTLMHVIFELLSNDNQGLAVPAAWGRLRDLLWQQKVLCERDMLLFGALLGGSHLQTAVKLAAHQCMISKKEGIDFGLAHFMTCDNRIPGHFMSIFEDGLRADIESAFTAMMELV